MYNLLGAQTGYLSGLLLPSVTSLFPAGKAAKYIGKLGFKLARNFGSDDPKPLSSGRTFEEEASSGNEGKKAHHLRALVAGHDGSVWVGFKAGRIERFRFNAKLLWSKVCHLSCHLTLANYNLAHCKKAYHWSGHSFDGTCTVGGKFQGGLWVSDCPLQNKGLAPER